MAKLNKTDKKVAEGVLNFVKYMTTAEIIPETDEPYEALEAYREILRDKGVVEVNEKGKAVGDDEMVRVYNSDKKLIDMVRPVPFFMDTYAVVIREMENGGDEEFGEVMNFSTLKIAEKYVNRCLEVMMSTGYDKDEIKKAKKSFTNYRDDDKEFLSRVYEINLKNTKIKILIKKNHIRLSSTFAHPVISENYLPLLNDEEEVLNYTQGN